MEFEWDGVKADSNLRKHGVDFADAATVLHDEQALSTLEHHSSGEERVITLGMDATARLLVVVYTWRGDVDSSSHLRKESHRPWNGVTT